MRRMVEMHLAGLRFEVQHGGGPLLLRGGFDAAGEGENQKDDKGISHGT
jgi:hypothetical protein